MVSILKSALAAESRSGENRDIKDLQRLFYKLGLARNDDVNHIWKVFWNGSSFSSELFVMMCSCCCHSLCMVVIITLHVWAFFLKKRDDKLIQSVTRWMEKNNITSFPKREAGFNDKHCSANSYRNQTQLQAKQQSWTIEPEITSRMRNKSSLAEMSWSRFPHWSSYCQRYHLGCNYRVIAEASAYTSWAPITGILPGMDDKCNWLCWHNCYKVITCYFLQRGVVTQAAVGHFQAVRLQSV